MYDGVIEFMKKEEWFLELQILLDECSTQDGAIFTHPPSTTQKQQENAAAAWDKIEQVYGRGHMSKFFGQPKVALHCWMLLDVVADKHCTQAHSITNPGYCVGWVHKHVCMSTFCGHPRLCGVGFLFGDRASRLSHAQ